MSVETTQPRGLFDLVVSYFRDFRVLKETRSEYWGLQVINFLDCTIFFAMLNIASVYLSKDFGFSDQEAGWILTVFTSGTTICLFFSGLATDWLGIHWSMYISMTALLILRLTAVLCGLMPEIPHRGWIVAGSFALSAPFMAMVQTMFQAANKRFTTARSRSAGFNLWYLFMNIGAAAGGFLIDIVRLWLGLPNAHIFSYGVISAVLCIIVAALTIRREDQLYGPDEKPPAATAVPVRLSPWENAARVLSESVFWRFAALITLLLGVRAVFAYMYLLMPKYWLRVIGEDARMGTLQAVNPILIIIGLIVLIPVLHRFNVYKMLVYGAMISGLSLFALVFPSHGNQTYLYSLLCLTILSIGELIWSPRLNEYTAAIAPEGQEGTYLGLSLVPWFVAKTGVSALSGYMLDRFCPEQYQGAPLREQLAAGNVPFWDSPSAMWLILALPAILGPIIALALRGWFTKGARWDTPAAAH